MRISARTWYTLVAVAALVPVGMRAATWQRYRPQPVDRAVAQAGHDLFVHEWTPGDPLAGGDGLGPVYNATSCKACHFQNGTGGSGGLESNVTTFTVRPLQQAGKAREGVLHGYALAGFEETLAHVHPDLPAEMRPALDKILIANPGKSGRARRSPLTMPRGVHLSQRNTPALFGAKLIDDLPEREILANERRERLRWGMSPAENEDVPVGRASRLAGGKVGRFGWKAQSASLASFVQAACANELGLGNPGQAQPRPLGVPGYQVSGLDLTLEQCDQLTAFAASLPRPLEKLPEATTATEQARVGKHLFKSVGCADCHTPDLGPVQGLYSDLLLHRMGEELEGGGSYNEPAIPIPDSPGDGPSPGEWRTPPLWGVADSAPYLHDGRAATLDEAIRLHGGQGARSAQRFSRLSSPDQGRVLAFLRTLRAP
jgi:CxxC motif-containing protein (DUF1111 family)